MTAPEEDGYGTAFDIVPASRRASEPLRAERAGAAARESV
jgi:hypothetical protein